MGFTGYMVSDSEAVEWLAEKHHTARDQKDAVRQAILAGLNVRTTFRPAESYILPLRELVREGTVPLSVIDARVRDVIRVKFWQGRFDAPYRPLKGADSVVLNPVHVALARRAAAESVVLLKNEDRTLPLKEKGLKTIAVCGPNAADPGYALGHYGALDVPVSTVLDALKERCDSKGIQVLHAKGCERLCGSELQQEIMWEPPSAAEQKGIDEAVGLVRQADATIVVVGDKSYGGDSDATSGENRSRISLNLTGRQDDLIRAVSAASGGKPVIVVIISGRPSSVNWANRLCPAILQAFSPGMEGGRAITDILFGDINPGGKLSCSIPKSAGQMKLNFPAMPASQSDRTPLCDSEPLWCFGHGLSYTEFSFGNLAITWAGKAGGRKPGIHDSITVTCDVTNSGRVTGDEVVQLYTRDLVSSVMTYEKNLRGFERIHLGPGETRTVSFTLLPDYLALWNRERQRVVEPGTFKVMVGNSSADIRRNKKGAAEDPHQRGLWLSGTFELTGD